MRDAINAREYVIHDWRYAAVAIADSERSDINIQAMTVRRTLLILQKRRSETNPKRLSATTLDRA